MTTRHAEQEEFEFDTILPEINESLSNADMFGTNEAKAAIQRMNDANDVMFSEGVIYRVT
jgi:DNA replication licensing factor MCM3